jgi:hypothetical protein
VNCPNAQKRPQRPIMSNPSAFVDNSSRAMAKNRFIVPIFIGNNNTPYVSYRDTGSHITLINSNLVDKSEYTGQTVVIQGVLEPKQTVPIARLKLSSPKFKFNGQVEVNVAVINPPLPFEVDCLLGNELFDLNPQICDLISISSTADERAGSPDVSHNESHETDIPVTDDTTVVKVSDSKLKAADIGEQNKVEATISFQSHDGMSNEAAGTTTKVQSKLLINNADEAKSHVCDMSQMSEPDTRPLPVDVPTTVSGGAPLERNGTQHTSVLIDSSRIDEMFMCTGGEVNARGETEFNEKHMNNAQTTVRAIVHETELNKHVRGQQSGKSQTVNSRKSVAQSGPNDNEFARDGNSKLVGESDQRVFDQKQLKVAGNKSTDCLTAEFQTLGQIDPSVVNTDYFTPATSERNEFASKQLADVGLKPLWQKAANGEGGFFVRDGLLYKKPEYVRAENDALLVVPECYKQKILETAHCSLQAGCHLGFEKTASKIGRVFAMKKSDIKQFVAACQICQRLRPKRISERAELVQVPIADLEFASKWVVDVSGCDFPRLSRARGNHKYILVCCDVATRRIELIALPSLKATAVANAILSNIIARFGCKTLVYDQASAFMSSIMQEMLKLLRVHSTVAIAGYHSATALAERWIRTVQHSLKAYIFDYKNNWNFLLPFIAFNLRQIPCW